ncbi:Abi family protein [Enterococcus durans]|uniref:Abi family protein n=1 Tax=Enterococcus durans TaxID=53345 RepID=UPI00232FD90D|nr:Abi family protein [Enterococcus durans]MDB1651923.1 Abi family protein [Enterococcus durans]MDB1656958.1 Abi family protein [Enterococcus durans]MDB1662570.1 Abi family protein [Enterococcus durans]MDB1668887.1 Abi family protein [Enterococcus durans]MDB1670568.1 Abi family protein [Enterococcus durans]
MAKKNNELDYTYFKKSIDVDEAMKEPKEGQEFIDILQKEDYGHMVLFSSAEKQQALNFFKYTNYYRFSVFPRLVVEDNKRTFSNVLYLYNVDKYIRKQLSHFSGILEEWIKTSLANVISNNYNSDEYQQAEFYLDLNIYGKEEQGKEILASFAETVTRSKEVYIKYHHREKNGCIPVWVLIEELTFGQIDTFISQLKPEYKNMWIDKVFGKQYRKFVVSWVGVARYIRNMTAHHARFYSKRFVVFPSLPKEDLKKYSIKNSQKDNLFVMLFTEKKLFSFLPDRAIQDEWNLFIDDLSELVDDSDDLFNCEENGFKEDWRTALKIF